MVPRKRGVPFTCLCHQTQRTSTIQQNGSKNTAVYRAAETFGVHTFRDWKLVRGFPLIFVFHRDQTIEGIWWLGNVSGSVREDRTLVISEVPPTNERPLIFSGIVRKKEIT